MARALIKHWSDMSWDGTWKQKFEAFVVDGYSRALVEVPVTIQDNDSQGQIKAKMADAVRAFVLQEMGFTVETNQVIFPDGSRG